MRRLKSRSRFANDALFAARPTPRLSREYSHVLGLCGLGVLEYQIYKYQGKKPMRMNENSTPAPKEGHEVLILAKIR
jgi:uncharacterized membrane protein YebE (DUF533 family)